MLVTPVGGGGLIAGCATVAKALGSSIRVIGVEPKLETTRRARWRPGERVKIDVPHTIADGLQAAEPGD